MITKPLVTLYNMHAIQWTYSILGPTKGVSHECLLFVCHMGDWFVCQLENSYLSVTWKISTCYSLSVVVYMIC